MAGTDIAIDLGTSSVKIFLEKKGIVLNEPAVIAVDTLTDNIVAIGEEAYKMIGRTSERTAVVRPMTNGVISDFMLAQEIIRYYFKKISGSRVFMPRVVVSVPCGITEVEKRAVVDTISSTGVRKICLIEEPVAAAMGAGVDISQPHGIFVVDIGGGTTDMAVISLSGVAISSSMQIAGSTFDDRIIKYIRKKYNLIIGERMAEEAKKAIGCVYPQKEFRTYRVKGRNALTGLPQWAEVTSEEMLEALIEGNSRAAQLAGGVRVERCAGVLRWAQSREEEPAAPQPAEPGEYRLPGGYRLRLELAEGEECEQIKKFAGGRKKGLTNCVDYDRIRSSLSLRTRQPGDWFRPEGRSGSKSLKKYFNEAGIPGAQRALVPLLAQGSQVIWLWGGGVAQGFAPTSATSRILVIRPLETTDKEQ